MTQSHHPTIVAVSSSCRSVVIARVGCRLLQGEVPTESSAMDRLIELEYIMSLEKTRLQCQTNYYPCISICSDSEHAKTKQQRPSCSDVRYMLRPAELSRLFKACKVVSLSAAPIQKIQQHTLLSTEAFTAVYHTASLPSITQLHRTIRGEEKNCCERRRLGLDLHRDLRSLQGPHTHPTVASRAATTDGSTPFSPASQDSAYFSLTLSLLDRPALL
ncbi:hypothetical protein BJ546DRAFT_547042 [Cryomyces antarcticus]